MPAQAFEDTFVQFGAPGRLAVVFITGMQVHEGDAERMGFVYLFDYFRYCNRHMGRHALGGDHTRGRKVEDEFAGGIHVGIFG